jgi:hypothetical protein
VSSSEMASNTTAPTRYVTAGDNKYAFRRFGIGPATPLLFLQHFTGTLDSWDPDVRDPLALGRSVILFESTEQIGTTYLKCGPYLLYSSMRLAAEAALDASPLKIRNR